MKMSMRDRVLAFWYTYLLDQYRELLPPIFYEQEGEIDKKSEDFLKYQKLLSAYIKTTLRIRAKGLGFIQSVQRRRLRKTLRVIATVPWWDSYFNAKGVDIRHVRTFEDMKIIPAITREDLKRVPLDDLRSSVEVPPTQVQINSTSGSTTGVPFKVLFLKNVSLVNIAAHYLGIFKAHGVPIERVWDQNFVIAFNMFGGERPLRTILTQFLSYSIPPKGEDPTACIVELVSLTRRLSGSVLFTHPSELLFLIQKLKELNVRPKFLLCMVIGQALDPEVRRLAEEYLQIKVVSVYGFREYLHIAVECPRRPGVFHMQGERSHLEILDDRGATMPPGQYGNLTFTLFDNPLMPLIRYQPGDVGRFVDQECECGNPHQRFELEQRQSDVFDFPNGVQRRARSVSQLFMREPYLSSILRYQVRQEAKDKVRILAVFGKGVDIETISKSFINDVRIAAQIPENVALSIEGVPAIEGTGKYKPFVSLATITAATQRSQETL